MAQPITVDDLYLLGWLEQPRYSPDGRAVAFVRVTVDRAANRYRRAIWLVPTDGGPPRRFTAGAASDSAPAWSPDGRWLAFVSDRGGEAPQLYLIAADGGEARCISSLPGGVSAPRWSPDGARIAFLSRASQAERAAEDAGPPPELGDEWQRRRAREQRQHDEAARFDPRVITRLPYRGGTSFFDDRRNHLYVIDRPANDDAPAPAPRRLTDGDLHYGAPAWMPDGSALLTTATRDPEADSLFAYYDVLRVPVPAQGRAEPVRLTAAGFSYYDPEPSPDGSLIALRRMPDDRPLAAGARIAVMRADGGELRDLTGEADLSVDRFAWQPDGHGLLYTAGWRGGQALHLAELAAPADRGSSIESSDRPQPSLLDPRSAFIEDFDIGPDGSVVVVAGTPANPCELYLRRPDGSERQLTQINAALLAERTVTPIEELSYPAPDGQQVQGWVLYPPGFDRAGSYPLAVHIHGGPHLMWGPALRSMWHEWQAAAARGYVVFFCNPRGSDGYGERWRDGIHANWGFADAPDILAGIDLLIARGGIDTARLGVTGGSYGGFMTAWLIGHTKRFACAVAARGVYNLQSEHSTSDAHELFELEFDGFPWEKHELYWRHSPLAYAHQISTPLRILHAEQDYRVPISEAEQLFALLRRRKQVVELVRYPREGHELTRSGEPRHRADHMERTIEWFDRFCRPERPE